MNFILKKNLGERMLIISIASAIGLGILLLLINPTTPIQTTKETMISRALQNVLKDENGNPIISTGSAQEYLLAQNTQYEISYQKTYDLFLISILTASFENVRDVAEREFITLLETDTRTACKLNVKIVTPSFANPELAGQQFPLSFCTQ